jgi:hypothetical protein
MKKLLKTRGLDPKLVDTCGGLHQLKLVGLRHDILQPIDCFVDTANATVGKVIHAMNVILVLPSGERLVTLSTDKGLVAAVASEIGLEPDSICIHFEDNYIEPGLTAADCCLVANSRLSVTLDERRIQTEPQVDKLAQEMAKMHPYSSYFRYLDYATFDENGNLKDWDLSRCKLKVLPEIFGKVKVLGNLNLSENELTALPNSFGKIEVGGDLDLGYNRLNVLPENFMNILVGGDLVLRRNPWTRNQLHVDVMRQKMAGQFFIL